MKSRDTFIFYRSIFESAQVLDIEDKVKFYEAIMMFSMDFKEADLEGIPNALFTLLKPTLSKSNTSYINGSKQKTSKAEAKQKPKASQTEANQKLTANNKDKDKDKDKDKEPLIPADIIKAYSKHISPDRTKIDENWTMKELRTKKTDYELIIKGIINYGKKFKGSDKIQKLSNFIANKIYLDYQEEKKKELQPGERKLGGFTY